ncbi:MAG: class D beta-lactamase [Bacteroidota bacterium]
MRHISLLTIIMGAITLFSCNSIRRDVPHPEWKAVFDTLNVTGSIIVQDYQDGIVHVYNPDRIDRAFSPASTFKIPHSLIALQTGAVKDTAEIIPWDSVSRFMPTWNRDHSMRTALPQSVVWFYQETARRIGQDSLRAYMEMFRYGNRDTSGRVDRFWLTGGLRITSREQIDFLRKLYFELLPVDVTHQRMVKDLLLLEKGDDYAWYGKTGWDTSKREKQKGWIVGWVEKGEKVYFYATHIDIKEREDAAKRTQVTRRVLEELGLI